MSATKLSHCRQVGGLFEFYHLLSLWHPLPSLGSIPPRFLQRARTLPVTFFLLNPQNPSSPLTSTHLFLFSLACATNFPTFFSPILPHDSLTGCWWGQDSNPGDTTWRRVCVPPGHPVSPKRNTVSNCMN